MGYLTNFIVYTLAMVGVMGIALIVFKKSTGFSGNGNAKCLKVLDTLTLGPRKTLYIVSAGEEKFLIAGDADRTNLISKLQPAGEKPVQVSFKETMAKADYMDKTIVGIHSTQKSPYNSVMKNLAEKIKG